MKMSKNCHNNNKHNNNNFDNPLTFRRTNRGKNVILLLGLAEIFKCCFYNGLTKLGISDIRFNFRKKML